MRYYDVLINERKGGLPPIVPYLGKPDPFEKYIHGHTNGESSDKKNEPREAEAAKNSNRVLAKVTGASGYGKSKSEILIQPFNLGTGLSYRCCNTEFRIMLFDRDPEVQAKHHPRICLSLSLTEKKEIFRFYKALWGKFPSTYVAMIIAIEEQYATEKGVTHTPWMRKYFAPSHKDIMACNNWEEFSKVCPQIFRFAT